MWEIEAPPDGLLRVPISFDMVFGCHATLPQRVLLEVELRDIVRTSALDTKLPNSDTHKKGMSGMHKTHFHVTRYKTT